MFSIFSGNVLARALGGASGVLLGAVLVSGGAMAQVDVPVGNTLTVPPDINEQVQLGDGATLLVEQGGIVSNAGDAVTDVADGISVAVDNNGTIQSSGADALDMTGSTLDLINRSFGLITGSPVAITADEIVNLRNDGSIEGGTVGVSANNSIVNLSNTGTIDGGSSTGVISFTAIEQLANAGVIRGRLIGLFTSGSIGQLTNSGTIFGELLTGVKASGSIVHLTNSGLIEGGVDGVLATVSIEHLINEAAIVGGDMGVRTPTIERLINSGTIMGGDSGVYADGNIEQLTNSGIIEGGTSRGVYADDTIGQLNNSGSIMGGNYGVYGNVSIGILTNTGVIEAGDYAVVAEENIGQLTNSGLIGGGEYGVYATDGTLGQLNNSGTIEGADEAVYANEIGQLINSGSILGGRYGVNARRGIAELTNSGLITGSFHAIRDFSGDTDTLLTLLAGSVIDGPIDLGGGTNTLVVSNGLSMATTFDDAPPVIGTTNGAPYTIQGNQVIVGDPTNLAMQGNFLANLTGNVFSALDGAAPGSFGDAGGTVVQPLGYAATPDEGDVDLPELITHGNATAIAGPELFAQTFGNFALQAAQFGTADAVLVSGGVVAGVETVLNSRMRAGLFGGAATGVIQTGNGAQQTGTDSFFGGVTFEMNSDGTGVDLKLLGGYNGNDRTRQVANNLVAGGIEDAEATYNSWFIAPELTASQQLGDSPLIASATLGYIGAWLDGFDETGSSGNMSVAARAIHIGHARLQLAMPVLQDQVDEHRTRIVLNGGVEGRVQFGDGTIEGTLAGDDFTFDAGAGANFAAFAGLSGTHQLDSGALLNGSANGRVALDGSIAVDANLGVSQVF